MDNPLNAMLFAEDLMEFVLERYGVIWDENKTGVRRFRNRIQKHFFKPDIGNAVFAMIAENVEAIAGSYMELNRKGINCIDDFRYEASITTIFYLKYGYNHKNYLNLCALFAGVTYYCFKNGDNSTFARNVATASTQLLAYVVNFSIYTCNFYPEESWFDLLITARIIGRKIENGLFYTISDDDDDEGIILPYFILLNEL
ncbi:uncharacterized protein NPIL_344771 [Nephila pilipes]|uniref:Uncharacterized protein n=1 Tax=Nephila pilipes TaxID=299642 RepID=A0A8X6MSP0_NEPPI|nr:uncharacterized protein NPIL_344771 [Nephila pilipes]